MNIGIEGFPFQKNPGGIGKYFQALVRLLIYKFPDANFFIYSNKDVFLPDDFVDKVKIVQDKSVFRHLPTTVWLKTLAGFTISKNNLDFYFSGAGFLPYLKKKTKKVILVHDLNFKIVPQTMGRLNFLSHFLFLKKDVKKSDYIIVNSIGTSEKVLTYFRKRVDIVINPPTDSRFRKLPQSETKAVLYKYGINYPYLLVVGTLEPRKNLQMTINVFIKLIGQGKINGLKLVIVGSSGWRNKGIIDLCEKYKKDIICLGYVDDIDLPALYNGALAFLFPSIYEGFGMPAREALYCGCQIITSDLVELRESCQNQAIFINPKQSEDFEKSILFALKNSEKYNYEISERLESDTASFLNFFVDKSL